jgi:hypothetical protein
VLRLENDRQSTFRQGIVPPRATSEEPGRPLVFNATNRSFTEPHLRNRRPRSRISHASQLLTKLPLASPLTHGTVKGRSAALDDPANRSVAAAPQARLAFAIVNAEWIVVAGPMLSSDRLLQHIPYRLN